jgi:hypothetical protein
VEILRYDSHTELPYAVEQVEGAEHLIVVFPRSVPGSPPLLGLRRQVGHFNAHRLYVGADEHLYFGPDRERRGARAAAELIRHVAAELEVEGPRVITFGTSWRALCALYVGLLAGAGRIVTGGTPVHFGWHVYKLEKMMPPDPVTAGRRQLLAGILQVDRDRTARAFWDALVLETAREATHEARIDMLIAPDDQTWPDAFWLAEKLVGHPTLRVSLTTQDYGEHADVSEAFYRFLDRKLIAEVGRAPEPAPERA